MTIDIQHFQTKLETERKTLEAELAKVGRPNPNQAGDWEVTPEDEGAPEFRDEVADHLGEMERREEVEVTLEQQLKNVNRALAKIKNGTYGICEITRRPIQPERLEADPSARTCKDHLADEDNLP